MNNTWIIQLALAKGAGNATIKKVISFLEKGNFKWEDLFLPSDSLLYEIGLKNEIVQNIKEMHVQAQRISDELENNAIDLLVENDKRYPQYLKKMLGSKCPPYLFVKGNVSLLNAHSVGFCGSRKASPKGICIAADCAKQLAEQGITVISGYASGTDLSAHKSALCNGGTTVFVLAEGILRVTVKNEIKEFLDAQNHVFVSQFPPQLSWNVGNAMNRNITILGLSRAMILVESGKTGGTFAAGEEALKAGCPLFVIDFAQPEVSAEANPYFIASGGHPIRGKNGVPNLSKVLEIVKTDARVNAINSASKDKTIEQIRLDIC